MSRYRVKPVKRQFDDIRQYQGRNDVGGDSHRDPHHVGDDPGSDGQRNRHAGFHPK